MTSVARQPHDRERDDQSSRCEHRQRPPPRRGREAQRVREISRTPLVGARGSIRGSTMQQARPSARSPQKAKKPAEFLASEQRLWVDPCAWSYWPRRRSPRCPCPRLPPSPPPLSQRDGWHILTSHAAALRWDVDCAIALISGLASLIGYVVFQNSPPGVVAFVLAVAFAITRPRLTRENVFAREVQNGPRVVAGGTPDRREHGDG